MYIVQFLYYCYSYTLLLISRNWLCSSSLASYKTALDLSLSLSRNVAFGHAEYFANPSCLFRRNFVLSLSLSRALALSVCRHLFRKIIKNVLSVLTTPYTVCPAPLLMMMLVSNRRLVQGDDMRFRSALNKRVKERGGERGRELQSAIQFVFYLLYIR